MKRVLSMLLTAVLAFSLFAVLPTTTASADNSGYFEYWIVDGEAAIAGFDEAFSGDVTIPSTLVGYPVTSIDRHAFRDCTSLKSVTIPKGVTSIGGWVFRECEKLKSVIIPEGVTAIGVSAFSGCTSL